MSKEDAAAARRKLEPDRTFIAFLCASLGDFMVPVGAPMLKELAAEKQGRRSQDTRTAASASRLGVGQPRRKSQVALTSWTARRRKPYWTS